MHGAMALGCSTCEFVLLPSMLANRGDLLGKFLLFKNSVTLTKLIHSNLDWDHKEEDERKRS